MIEERADLKVDIVNKSDKKPKKSFFRRKNSAPKSEPQVNEQI